MSSPGSAWNTPWEQREEAGHEVRVALRQAPLLLELLQRDDDLDCLLERVDADRVARPSRADRERPVAAVGGAALDVDAEVPVARGDRGDGQRVRDRRRLGDDGGVGREPRLEHRGRPELVLHRLLADDGVQEQVSLELDARVGECLGDQPHRGVRALHVRRTDPVETLVPDLGVPRAAVDPVVGIDGRDGVHVAVESKRAATARRVPSVSPTRFRRSGSGATQWVSRPACS